MAADYGAEPEARDLCAEINRVPKQTTKQDRDIVILEYRARGILK